MATGSRRPLSTAVLPVPTTPALHGRDPQAAGLSSWSGRAVADGDIPPAVSLTASAEHQAGAEARFP